MFGTGGQIINGKQLLLKPTPLPGNHSTLPCFPRCIIAFALNECDNQKYCAIYLCVGGRSGECKSDKLSYSKPLFA